MGHNGATPTQPRNGQEVESPRKYDRSDRVNQVDPPSWYKIAGKASSCTHRYDTWTLKTNWKPGYNVNHTHECITSMFNKSQCNTIL